MEIREQLMKEYWELTKKYLEIDGKIKKLEPPITHISDLEETKPWFFNVESLNEFDRLWSEREEIQVKRREIMQKLASL